MYRSYFILYLLYDNIITSIAYGMIINALNAIISTSVQLVVNYRRTNNRGAFRRVVNLGLCGKISSEARSIDMHRSIRFLLVLMLNFEMQMSYQLSTRSAGPAAARNDE